MSGKEVNRKIDEIYIDTVKSYRMEASKSESDDWRKHFHDHPQHLQKAIEKWKQTTEIDPYFNRPKGAIFPRVTDLLLLIEQIEKEARRQVKFQSCGKCNRDGWVLVEIPSPLGGKVKAARRCECFEEWARAKALVA